LGELLREEQRDQQRESDQQYLAGEGSEDAPALIGGVIDENGLFEHAGIDTGMVLLFRGTRVSVVVSK
jgi:hypothetical protein